MNEEAYANHIIQKHRLAVAIAVIKNKPTNLTTDEYLQLITYHLNPRIDNDSIIGESVCSEDFDTYIEDDDINDDNLPIVDIFEARVVKTSIMTSNVDTLTNGDSLKTTVTKDVAKIGKRRSNIDTLSKEDTLKATVTKDIIQTDINTSNVDTLPMNVEECVIEIIPFNITENYTKSNEETNDFDTLPLNLIENHLFNNNNLSSRKQDHILDIHSDKERSACLNEYTHTSVDLNKDSQFKPSEECEQNEEINEIDLDRTMTIDGDENGNNRNGSMNILEGLEEMNKLNEENEVFSEVFELMKNSDLAIVKQIESQRTYCGSLQSQTPKPKTTTQLIETADDDNDSQKTLLYTIETANNTHYSQSQTQNIVIQSHFINNNVNKEPSVKFDNVAINKIVDEDKNMHIDENDSDRTLLNSERDVERRFSIEDFNNKGHVFSDDEELSMSQSVLPFKIIEEMNKIKASLVKRYRRFSTDGHSTDSGYRSDSQKSLRNSLHVSENWLGQSGCSLLRHLMQCQLTNNTQDIYNEISQVLGDLIDSLHADEKYPTFLEEILENIDKLLMDLHEEPNDGDCPLQKEEYLHRLILLNKSSHTQKYTISKITSILEITHTQLTQSDTIYEITNINKIENLSYIFHLLNIIIKKYIKTKPNTQNETKICDFKKSYLSEVWRKKWLSVPVTTVHNEENNNICVLTKCMNILNKIVINSIEGYSLISYSALECYNLLQN